MTAKEARRLIRRARHDNIGTSRVNRGITHTQALDILEEAVRELPNDHQVRDLMERNIRRECGELL